MKEPPRPAWIVSPSSWRNVSIIYPLTSCLRGKRMPPLVHSLARIGHDTLLHKSGSFWTSQRLSLGIWILTKSNQVLPYPDTSGQTEMTWAITLRNKIGFRMFPMWGGLEETMGFRNKGENTQGSEDLDWVPCLNKIARESREGGVFFHLVVTAFWGWASRRRTSALVRPQALTHVARWAGLVGVAGIGPTIHELSTLSNQVIVLLCKLLVNASSLSWILDGEACHLELSMAIRNARIRQPQSPAPRRPQSWTAVDINPILRGGGWGGVLQMKFYF